MERFDAANRCPECGSRAASYKLHATPCLHVGAGGKHMHRQCPSCGFQWAEETLSPRSVELSELERDEERRRIGRDVDAGK